MIFQVQSTLALLLLFYGLSKTRHRSLHAKIMAGGILWDLAIVVQIELSRQAIERAQSFLTNEVILNVHLVCSFLTLLGYGGAVVLGWKLLKGHGGPKVRRWHKRVGLSALAFRVASYGTSYFVPL